ncbi:MAG: PAS domain-containing protein [Planctomycetes bacterium]|nr:PAS domain-containing protein [Planctomycetota bacterium]
MLDRQFRLTRWSSSAEAMFGWTAAEAVGRDVFELLGCHPTTRHDPIARWQSCRFASTKRCRDGSLLEVEVRFEPLHATDDDELGVMTILGGSAPGSEAEARYASVVAAMQEGVVVQGIDGVIQSCNAAAVRILGLSEDSLRGVASVDPRWRAVREDGSPWPGDDHPAMVALRTGQASSGQIMGVHRPCGSLAWISINSQPIRLDANGPHHAVVTTFVDVTEQRLAQERVRKLTGLLPVCAWCKSVRNDQGYWQQIELYLSENTDARPTHGLCPDCSGRVMK